MAAKKKTYETVSFYGGAAVIEKVPHGEHTRFRRAGEKSFLLSATRVTGHLDKSRVLIPWAVGLVAAHVREKLCVSGQFSSEEILLVVNEAVGKPDEKKEAGGATGTVIHDFCRDFARAKMAGQAAPSLDHIDEDTEEGAKALNGINAFLDWYNGNKVEFVFVEEPVYFNSQLSGDAPKGPLVEYVGIVDAVAYVNGELRVIDYKTSKGVYDDQRFQVAAYVRALANDSRVDKLPDGASILNFNKETGDLIHLDIPLEEVSKDFEAFEGLYRAAARVRELAK